MPPFGEHVRIVHISGFEGKSTLHPRRNHVVSAMLFFGIMDKPVRMPLFGEAVHMDHGSPFASQRALHSYSRKGRETKVRLAVKKSGQEKTAFS